MGTHVPASAESSADSSRLRRGSRRSRCGAGPAALVRPLAARSARGGGNTPPVARGERQARGREQPDADSGHPREGERGRRQVRARRERRSCRGSREARGTRGSTSPLSSPPRLGRCSAAAPPGRRAGQRSRSASGTTMRPPSGSGSPSSRAAGSRTRTTEPSSPADAAESELDRTTNELVFETKRAYLECVKAPGCGGVAGDGRSSSRRTWRISEAMFDAGLAARTTFSRRRSTMPNRSSRS